MATNALRSLWAEPRPANAPDRGPRDWALVAALAGWSVVEVVLRQDLAPRPLLLLYTLAVLGPLLWRRTHPLAAVAASFGTLTILDSVRILTGSHGGLLDSMSAAPILATPKTHQQRTVPIPAVLLEPLSRRCESKGRDDLVLTSPAGAVLRSGNFRWRFFDPAAKTAGLEHLSPHDLRHTAASLLVASGANVKAVQRMLGHASAAMTLDVYADLFDEDLESVATALDQAREAAGIPLRAQESVGFLWGEAHSATYRPARKPRRSADRGLSLSVPPQGLELDIPGLIDSQEIEQDGSDQEEP